MNRRRLTATACLLLLTTPLLLALAGSMSYLLKQSSLFFPLLAVWLLVILALAWRRSRRSFSRLYWATMLSQFVLLLSFEVWCALKLSYLLLGTQ